MLEQGPLNGFQRSYHYMYTISQRVLKTRMDKDITQWNVFCLRVYETDFGLVFLLYYPCIYCLDGNQKVLCSQIFPYFPENF